MEEALLLRIKLGCRSGKPAHVDSTVKSLIWAVRVWCVYTVLCDCVCLFVCLCVWQFHDLLSQTTSPLSQMDPYTSRSMDMLLPLTEPDRRRRDQDCSVSLRSYSERPRSVVSSTRFHFCHVLGNHPACLQCLVTWCWSHISQTQSSSGCKTKLPGWVRS